MRFVSIAGRYSRALLNAALKSGKEEEYERLLGTVVDVYNSMRDFFDDPTVSSHKKWRLMMDILTGSGIEIDGVFRNFIEVVFEKKRQRYLPIMAMMFSDMKIEAKGMVAVDVFTPHELDAEDLKILEEFVESRTGRKPSFRIHLDESLIAGVRLEFEGMSYDVSVSGRLRRMYREVFGKG